MALFKSKKKESKDSKKNDKTKVKSETTGQKAGSLKRDLNSVLKKPRITEKGAIISGAHNVYPFDIRKDANKKDVIDAIKTIYKVTPVKVAILKVPAKTKISRRTGKRGTQSGGKKAYVYLKKGDKIEFV